MLNSVKCLCASALFSLFFISNAYALTIEVDPGIVGSSFNSKSFEFDDLNGHAVYSGNNTEPLDFVFSESKNLTVSMNNSGIFNANIELTIANGYYISFNFFPVSYAFLNDEYGDTILMGSSLAIGTSAGANLDGDYIARYDNGWLSFDSSNPDGITFFGISYGALGFPYKVNEEMDWSIESARLTLGFNTSSGLLSVDSTNPGSGPAPVPEPSTILLLGLGLGGMMLYGRKRKHV